MYEKCEQKYCYDSIETDAIVYSILSKYGEDFEKAVWAYDYAI